MKQNLSEFKTSKILVVVDNKKSVTETAEKGNRLDYDLICQSEGNGI